MTAPLPGGGRRAIVALRAAIEKGLVEAPKPVEYKAPPVTMAYSGPVAPKPVASVAPVAVAEPSVEPQAEPEKRKGGRPKLAGDPAYRRAKPFPHAVIDDFLPDDMAEEAFLAFPNADDPIWREHGREFTGDGHSRKLECAKVEAMPEALRKVFELLTGEPALAKLKALTGFDDLFADPSLYGGGINLVEPGGFLQRHSDYNWSEALQAYRVCNLILWLNPDWTPQAGGELELWADGKCARKVEPLFNRAILFTCSKDAIHGYQPVGATRRSIAAYFYRKDAPKGFDTVPHRTIWHE